MILWVLRWTSRAARCRMMGSKSCGNLSRLAFSMASRCLRTSSAALEWKARRAAAIILVAANDMGIERIYSSCPSWLGLGFHKLSLSLSISISPPTTKHLRILRSILLLRRAQEASKIQRSRAAFVAATAGAGAVAVRSRRIQQVCWWWWKLLQNCG